MAFPEVVPREQWLEARLQLLAEEKTETRRRDVLNAKRRRLPMVRIEKEYVFDGPQGPVTLAGLFGDSRQLIIQHIMFGPDWDAACPSCTNAVDELSGGLFAHLRARDTAFVLVSRAPLAKLEAYRASRGWRCPGTPPTAATSTTTSRSRWMSRFRRCPTTTGPNRACSAASGPPRCPATAVSCARGSEIFHTYSTYGRGNEYTPSLYTLLDLTALGRQEAWEEPEGRAPVLHDT